jgi:hypothetical protein
MKLVLKQPLNQGLKTALVGHHYAAMIAGNLSLTLEEIINKDRQFIKSY